jgi:hypothetical protein
MVLVSESPGEDHGALGVVTLEDVIEELIGEEIVDETDVFVDVSRHLKRINPAAAFAHSFHRISSRQTRQQPEGTKPFVNHVNQPTTTGQVKPLNKAKEPNPTNSRTVTIKPGAEVRNAQYAATVVSQEDRLMGKKAARENYGTITSNGEGDEFERSQGAATLIEERITTSTNGENGKVVISPVKDGDDTYYDEHRTLL